MSYQPFLIASYATGLDKELQPWLLPIDAFSELFDGFVYRGVTRKRDGYSGYARGVPNSPYTESRMVHNITFSYTVTGDIDGMNDTYAIQLVLPVAIGSVHVFGSNPVQQLDDDGAGAFTGDGTGTINYVTGAVSVVFTAPPAIGSTVTVTYGNFSVGDGTAGPYTATLANIPIRRGTVVITAGAQVANDDGIGGFTGDVVAGLTTFIDYTTGSVSVLFSAIVASGEPITITYDYHQGLPVMGIMSFYPNDNTRQLIVADTRYVNRYDSSTSRLVDIPAGTYSGGNADFWSWVNYADPNSVPRLLFSNGVVGDVIQQWNGTVITNYAPTFSLGTLNARQIFNIRDRLVLFRTVEGGTLFPRRIRISGFGMNCDNFDVTATGAGFIDIPDNTWFYGATSNRDDLIFFTEAATWILKYTGNDITPFQLQKLDGSRGCKAAFSVISYLNRTMAASPRGLIMSDGYQVERMDNNIPDFSFNEVSDQFFDRCFSGFIDEDRDVYMIYPSEGDPEAGFERPPLLEDNESDRILVSNFEEDNFAIYNIPLSCMGNFQVSDTITWADLTAANGFPNWDTLSAIYGNWNAFAISVGSPIAIGGGHKGEIWSLNTTETEDNPQLIRNITVISSKVLEVTTDWNNYEVGDYINFEAILGMTEINDKQFPITSITTPWNVFQIDITGIDSVTPYISGGVAEKSIIFSALSKQLNPFVEGDKKLRCGWMYFYVSTTDTDLTDGFGAPVQAILEVEVIMNDRATYDPSIPTFKYEVDCTTQPESGGTKKWVKIWINQTAKFLQFRLKNKQPGAKIQVHAMMPGLSPVGRLV